MQSQNLPISNVVQQPPEQIFHPTKMFKIFGGIQIGVGGLCAIVSFIGVMKDGVNMYKDCSDSDDIINKYSFLPYHYMSDYSDSHYMSYYDCLNTQAVYRILFNMYMTCLFFSAWFFLTGVFPFCMTERRKNKCRCLKIAFMVLCIIGACIIAPGIAVCSYRAYYVARFQRGKVYSVALPVFLFCFGIVGWLVLIIAASYCCAKLRTDGTPGMILMYQQDGIYQKMTPLLTTSNWNQSIVYPPCNMVNPTTPFITTTNNHNDSTNCELTDLALVPSTNADPDTYS